MIDKKTLGLAIVISWALTLVTVLLISNFAPSLTQPFTQQSVELQSVKVVNLQKREVMNISKIIEESPYGYFHQNFTWTPSNPSNNAILGIVCSFEYKVNAPAQTNWNLRFAINVYKYEYHRAEGLKTFNTNEEWELTSFKVIPRPIEVNWINPNQSEYPIRLTLYGGGDAQTYIRNVTLMLLVVDG